ncbi:hypothetical protein [Vreelandella populi]|uniref:hypothetical protein n=1 Tax=Vreelandella populi TaxID=2498858 RepID=UPI000F8D20C8|nr:hypothetical protein [Halomonas populi]RUR52711.1 hypothetical protein ELY40_11715 [Halomonas populi]
MSKIEFTSESSVWYRLWSNQAQFLAGVSYLQMALPFREGIIPAHYFAILGALLNTAGFFLRNVKQPGLSDKVREKELRNG